MRIWDVNKGIGIYDYKDGGYQNLDISRDGKLIITCIGDYLLLYPAKFGGTFVPEEEEIIKTIYPNPTTDLVTIEFELETSGTTTIELLDTKGSNIKTILNKFLESGSQKYDLKTSDIPNGSYFLIVQSEHEQLFFQLIVNH